MKSKYYNYDEYINELTYIKNVCEAEISTLTRHSIANKHMLCTEYDLHKDIEVRRSMLRYHIIDKARELLNIMIADDKSYYHDGGVE